MASRARRRILWIGGCILAAGLIGMILGIPMSLLALTFSESAREMWRQDPWHWLSRGVLLAVYLAVLTYLVTGIQERLLIRRLDGSTGSDSGRRLEKDRKHTHVVQWMLVVTLLAVGLLGAMALGASPVEGQLLRVTIIAGVMGMVFGQVFAYESHSTMSTWARADLRAQIKTLQAQINPHFFFNTLNSIAALIPENPQAAERTVGLLADMSRYSFAGIQSEFVSLAEELKFVRDYLEIEELRFGERLRFELPEATDVENIRIPALTLQPLIENAVRHGISKLIAGGKISVRVQREGESFSLTVENDVDPESVPPESEFFKAGHALENIRRRWQYYYPPRMEHAVSLFRPRRLRERIPAGAIRVTLPRRGAVAVTITAPLVSLYDRQLHLRHR